MTEPEICTALKGVLMKRLIDGNMRLIYDYVMADLWLS